MAVVNYVKFVRCSPTVYENLLSIDQDTLYFVFERQNDYGSLYLGDRLISSGVSAASSLAGLDDITISDLHDGQVLIYDAANQTWKNSYLSGSGSVDIMTGATAQSAGTSGLVPVPQAGAQELFLRGDGVWAAPVGTISPKDLARITALQNTVDSLVGDSAIPGEDDTVIIPSIYDIAVEALTDKLIPEDAQASLDTLQEIASWIQSHPDDVATINNNITNLQTSVDDLQDQIDAINLGSGFVLQTTYDAEVGDLSQLNRQVSASSTIVEEINSINERLTWTDVQ